MLYVLRMLCNKDLVQSAVVTILSQHCGVMGLFPSIWAEMQKAGAAEGEAASPGLAVISVHRLLCLHVSVLCV